MANRCVKAALASMLVLVAAGCAVARPRLRASAFEFLYPGGPVAAEPARDVALRVPARIGLAFAPSANGPCDPFSESQKRALLLRMADAFRARDFVGALEVVPSSYLAPGGGFTDLDRLAAALGLDLVALVSYDQAQFAETTNAAWTYLTVVGAFVVRGEKNETRTVVDAVVYDIRSRALLLRAAGESTVRGSSTPVAAGRAQRLAGEEGFDLAAERLIVDLDAALEAFREQVRSGTVRGIGTPAIEVVRTDGAGGAGAFGAVELLALAVLAGALGRRRRGARR